MMIGLDVRYQIMVDDVIRNYCKFLCALCGNMVTCDYMCLNEGIISWNIIHLMLLSHSEESFEGGHLEHT